MLENKVVYSDEVYEFLELSNVELNVYLNFLLDKVPVEYKKGSPYYEVFIKYFGLEDGVEITLTKDILYNFADIINSRFSNLSEKILNGELKHPYIDTCKCSKCVYEIRVDSFINFKSELSKEITLLESILEYIDGYEEIVLNIEKYDENYLNYLSFLINNIELRYDVKLDIEEGSTNLVLKGDLLFYLLIEIKDYLSNLKK